jgi:hypothetical protein
MVESLVLRYVALALSAFFGSSLSAFAQGEPTVSPVSAPVRKVSPFHTVKLTENAKHYFVSAWGVDKLKVSYTSSGNLIRFSYRVEVPEQAKPLSEKSSTPYLYGQTSHAVLQVPVMDKVGPLRQSAPPVAGQEYWMVFSNKGNLVKPGDRVNVVIGAFHADGLLVE